MLSGGERNRYALLRMLLHPANFLLLDEPTNHLDMRAKDVLLEALAEYTGTVVFVSHDRYFIDKLATRVFEIGEGRVEVYPGNYEDYLWRKQGGAESAAGGCRGLTASSTARKRQSALAPRTRRPTKRLNPIKRKQMEERFAGTGRRNRRAETAIAACEAHCKTSSAPRKPPA